MTTDREQLAAAASSWVHAALRKLRDGHVVPRPRYDPHVRMGTNMDGALIRSISATDDLETLIEAVVPRFRPDGTSSLPRDSEVLYTTSLIEACATRVNRLGTALHDDHPELDDLVGEFVESVLSDTVEVVCCRVVGHLGTSTEEVLALADVEVIPIRGDEISTDRNLYATLRTLVPACGRADGLEPHETFGSEPVSLVVTRSDVETGHSPATLDNPETMQRRIDDMLLALDLLFGGTAHSIFDIIGSSREVSGVPPRRTLFQTGPVSRLWYQRPVRIADTDTQAIAAVRALVAATKVAPTSRVVPPMRYALRRFVGAKFEPDLYDGIVSLVISLEASLLPDDPSDIGANLSRRCADLISTEQDSHQDVMRDIKLFYSVRSDVTHGRQLDENRIVAKLRRVSKVGGDIHDRDVIVHATDRLRELTRRALLCRLVLGSGDEPAWPFETGKRAGEMTAAFESPATLADWRSKWQAWGADNGVPWVTEAVGPLARWQS